MKIKKILITLTFILSILCMAQIANAAEVNISNSNVTATGMTRNSTLLVSLYDENGALKGVRTYTGTGTVNANYRTDMDISGASEVKAFIWNMNTLEPLCDAKSSALSALPDNGETKIKITVGNRELTATLYDNPTSRAFIDMLPVTLPMLDLYGNEMCYRFDNALPTDDVQTRGYEVGEIIYWPPRHSFVIRYAQNGEVFDMQSIGRVDSGVEIFNGMGNTDVTFELIPSATPAPTPTATPTPSPSSGSRTLVAYFSQIDNMPAGADAVTYATPQSGNTRDAAQAIQKETGGDLFEIKTTKTYPQGHTECSQMALSEYQSDYRPELSTHIANMDDYDTVFIGFPIWRYVEPMAIRSFLEEYDFTGKTIIPFCTSMAVSVDGSVEDIKRLCPTATVESGNTFSTETDSSQKIADWIKSLNLNNSKETEITLTVGDTVLNAVLNDSTSSKDLISRLPVTVTLGRSAHDYCGGIYPPLAYDEDDVHYGWNDGDLAFWTAGDDFVIFFDDEEISSNTGNVVTIGKVTDDLDTVFAFPSTITVTVDLK